MKTIARFTLQPLDTSQNVDSFEALIKLLCKLEHLDKAATQEFLDLCHFSETLTPSTNLENS